MRWPLFARVNVSFTHHGIIPKHWNAHLLRLNETGLLLDDLLSETTDRLSVIRAELDASAAPAVAPDALVDQAWTSRAAFRAGTQIEMPFAAPAMRQAIQLGAAASAAIVLGELLSPQRWYSAVLATFVIFLGTSSAGETRAKAWSRIAGTALGVAAGIAVGYALRADDVAAFCMLVLCLFAAVYTIRLSYAFMIFFITIVLSMLYVLLGLFSDQLLLIRLAETALGAVLGGRPDCSSARLRRSVAQHARPGARLRTHQAGAARCRLSA